MGLTAFSNAAVLTDTHRACIPARVAPDASVELLFPVGLALLQRHSGQIFHILVNVLGRLIGLDRVTHKVIVDNRGWIKAGPALVRGYIRD
ncbi:MAG: hypothetical protein A4E58_00302 [Syntrophorhabdus sp. PtaB.Bin006]|nr:MAG: hypothetical protein A4E58_00302 [Syntrophorhabdus sp. PtaB.Bin006]